jgi:hypothetical protein
VKISVIGCLVAAIFVSACSSTPNVVYRYYGATARTTVTVTRTVDCDASKTRIVEVSTPSISTVYTADKSTAPMILRIKDLSSAFADSDIAFTWFDDGRLKSVNQSSTGQGEGIAKSALTLAAALAPVGGAAPAAKALPECDAIAAWGGGKPVTLSYTKQLAYGPKEVGKTFAMETAPHSEELHAKLKGQLPALKLQVGKLAENEIIAAPGGSDAHSTADNAIPLELRRTADVALGITEGDRLIWSAVVTVPTLTPYSLPIPKPAFFGKQSFGLTLSEAGAVTAVSYGKTTGAASALNVLNSLDSTFSPTSDAAKASALKAQADIIAQQQRLARCQAQPDKCQ